MRTEMQSAMMENTLQELFQRNNKSSSRRKPFVLALLCSHIIGMQQGFDYLRKLRDENITLRIAAEEEVLYRYSKQELIQATGNDDWIPVGKLADASINELDAIILPILSFSIITDLVSLNDQRPFVRLIIKALLMGKKVIAIKSGADPFHPLWKMEGMDKGSALFKTFLKDNTLKLQSYGVKLIDENETVDFSVHGNAKKTVITEETIHFAHQQNKTYLLIMKDTIITPLARDTAKELNIALITE
jgi:hypothetical protein